ncbi:MAG: hypothetical protein SOY99_02735 [Alloprevotella sp.]|nr:hypothetical protein [Alloprevotella sp.]
MKRMTIFRLLQVCALTCVLTACSTLYVSESKTISKISYGMTPKEVEHLLDGRPDYRRFDRDNEQWEYHWTRTIIVIDFENGRVVRLNTFPKPPAPPTPSQGNLKRLE